MNPSLCRSIWQQTRAAFHDKFDDIHTRLMKKNYDPVPQWWFYTLLVVIVSFSMLACEGFGRQLQLPYWGVLLAMLISLLFALPVSVITATTNQVSFFFSLRNFFLYRSSKLINTDNNLQQVGLNVITELIIGYMYPGRPLANITFKTYGTMSLSQSIMFLSDFKLGHYMKIPPKSMFFVQVISHL